MRCEFCGRPATHSARDINASGPWVDVCDGCADRVTEHIRGCDCGLCEVEGGVLHFAPGEVVLDQETGEFSRTERAEP